MGEKNLTLLGIEEIKNTFRGEFGDVAKRFEVLDLSVEEARVNTAAPIGNPGVYVWWNRDMGVLKVGRHFTNSRKRAFEHERDNTAGEMADLIKSPNARLILFNVWNEKDIHWVAALEIFLESEVNPRIKSGRRG
jgi:hypothetical protein